MTGATVGVLHPGEMGAALGSTLRGRGHVVLWASAGRSDATARRADAAGLLEVASVDELVARSDTIFSVCPPHAAADVARTVAGYSGIYVDANAISPMTSRAIATSIEQAGGTFVDGGIVGPPPRDDVRTRLYLSGAGAESAADLFAGSAAEAIVVSNRIGDASALKMAYAAWSKGTTALLLAIRDLAHAEGVQSALIDEWRASLPELEPRLSRASEAARQKGWRWVGEMEEIADTFAVAGLPDGFHRAAAEIFRRAQSDHR